MPNELTISKDERISSTSMIMHEGNLDRIKAFSSLMSGSNMVPDHFKGNSYDCAIVVAKALSMGMDPVAMSQEVFPVKGKMTYGSKLIIAMIHSCGMVEPRTFIKHVGDWDKKGRLINGSFQNEQGLGVQVGFKFIGDNDPTWGSVLMLSDQTIRNSPLWKTDPQQQMTYLASKRWTSIHLPGVTMGMTLAEEMQDSQPNYAQPERDITPSNESQGVDFSDCQDAENSEILEKSIKQTQHIEKVLNDDDLNEVNQEQDGAIEVSTTVQLEPSTTIEQIKETAQTALNEVIEEINNPYNPDNLPNSPLGVVFDNRYMTGSVLANKEWRLSKKGKEHFAKLEKENLEQKTEEIINKEPQQKKYVRAISQEAIEILGTDQPFKITTLNDDGTVEMEGVDGCFPIIDPENPEITHLEFCDNVTQKQEGTEIPMTQEQIDALATTRSQIENCKNAIPDQIKKLNADLSTDQVMELQKLYKDCVARYDEIAKLTDELTKEDFDEIKESNLQYWRDAKTLIVGAPKKQAEDDFPFA